jgi:pyrimidine-nucleoside phosphorylase
MRMTDIIIKKRDGGTLTRDEIQYLVDGVTRGSIPDEQTSAFLMAVYFRGMTPAETVLFTQAMARSGDVVDLSPLAGVKADKHSTGGVGDKTTLIVVPMAAACGVTVAKMSGKGLGHTGGTVDKLASIPGFKTELTEEEFFDIVRRHGLCVAGQSGDMAPADKKLYALRDVTGTVESLPLIAASIMSKKLAAGADCILLDVKSGSGAFMKSVDDAKALAQAMVDIGNGAGKKTMALITGMDRPLGYAIGNALEVIESVEALKGNGPSDLHEICVTLSAYMLHLAGKGDLDTCRALAQAVIKNGKAFDKLCDMVRAQGGDAQALQDYKRLPQAQYVHPIKALQTGYIQAMDTLQWGMASVALGAGRARKDDPIDYGAGIVLAKKTGDFVQAGETVAQVYTNDQDSISEAVAVALKGLTIGDEKPVDEPLVLGVVG